MLNLLGGALYSDLPMVAYAFARNFSLRAVNLLASALKWQRKVVDEILCGPEEFPFLVIKMSPYFDR